MSAEQHEPSFTCKCLPPKLGASSRNLVVCIDGTCNRFGVKNTNIVELYSQLEKSDEQLTYYSKGIGVAPEIPGHYDLTRQTSDVMDIAVARHLEERIMKAYEWLSNTYEDGDKIFLFGFSRGAYQVRALAGMIERVGLVHPGNSELVSSAYAVYSKSDAGFNEFQTRFEEPANNSEQQLLAESFKSTFCRADVRVHFVGAWDTVSSVGTFRSKPLPLTVTSCDHVCHFRHALALDERRVKFLPEYVYGGRANPVNDDHIKEVWFPGSHSDVGGGNRRNPRLQSGDIPLLWMRSEASAAGLLFKPSNLMWKIDDLDKSITPPLNLLWWGLELLPFRRLCYNNTNQTTFRPHMGGSRRILPGQKVHISALFKANYKPYARFHRNFESWPPALFWNDPKCHNYLSSLSSTWETDIFDSRSVQSLLDAQQPLRANLDALERLSFMASFDNGRKAIAHASNAQQTLASLLDHQNDWIRICAAMTYSEVGWEWPLQFDNAAAELKGLERLAADVESLLHDKDKGQQLHACMSLPSLCKNSRLREILLEDRNFRRLIRLTNACNTAFDRKQREQEGISASTVALHSAQALTSLLELDGTLASKLIAMGGVKELVDALHDDHDAVLVAVLRTLYSLAGLRDSHTIMSREDIVPTLLGLARRSDDFVAPAAVEVVCPIAADESMRATLLGSGALSLFNDMLRKRSDAVMEAGAKGLATFAKHDEQAIIKSGLLMKLAKDARSPRANHRDGSIRGLVALNAEIPVLVQRALDEARTVSDLISQLRKKSRALPAASALLHLMAIDHVVDTVTKSEAPGYILNMLKRRWFDGDNGEDGVGVLQRVLEIGPLRAAILDLGTVDALQSMLAGENSDTVYAGLQYLREVIKHDDGKSITCRESIISPMLKALARPHLPLQRNAAAILRAAFIHNKHLRPVIIEGLLSKLDSRKAAELLGVTTALRVLSFDQEVRDAVVTNTNFWGLSHDYYNILKLEYDKTGPNFREVYQSVGFLIKCVQGVVSHRQPDDSQWLESAPYEFRKDHNTVLRV